MSSHSQIDQSLQNDQSRDREGAVFTCRLVYRFPRFLTGAALNGSGAVLTMRSAVWLCGLVAGCATIQAVEQEPPWIAVSREGMVASDSVHASRAGAAVLRAGGNAIDAAAATSFALAVTRPYSTGFGGGGFFMVRMGRTGEVFVLDCRERAPAAATPDMYTQAHAHDPDGPSASLYGGLAAGVPGLLAGHAKLLERLGSKPLAELVEPARRLAADGFAIDDHLQGAIEGTLDRIADQPALATSTAALRRTLLFDGEVPAVGEVLRQPVLARTLASIGTGGADWFYRGPAAEVIARAVQADGGIMTAEDLARYEPTWREPIRARYRDRFELLLMPPPSSGGVCIAETLNILERWGLRAVAAKDPGRAAHLTVEAIKHAFADRARHLGDMDFASVPVRELTAKAYAKKLAARIREDGTSPPEEYGRGAGGFAVDDSGTSHYCVADRWGNVVAATETINTGFGSLLMVESLGIVLNNEMDDFTAEPGQANAYGLQQSAANAVAPFKRPLSSMSPTIVLRDGKPLLAVGASGGPRIITATLQVILGVVEYDLTLEEAIDRPRLHHQWQPDVAYRNGMDEDSPAIEGLRKRGHEVSDRRRGAVVQALLIDGDQFIGASDPRKGGAPAAP